MPSVLSDGGFLLLKGERENEPLWDKSEKPEKTEFPKILKLKNSPYDRERLKKLLQNLKQVCFLSKENENYFRNTKILLKILCEDVNSLKNMMYDKHLIREILGVKND